MSRLTPDAEAYFAAPRSDFQQRVERVAKALFPEEFSDGTDCHDDNRRPGEPCEMCAANWAGWQERLTQVSNAIKGVFP
jgi:hypothetical protein